VRAGFGQDPPQQPAQRRPALRVRKVVIAPPMISSSDQPNSCRTAGPA
jgi:hypothetical protein